MSLDETNVNIYVYEGHNNHGMIDTSGYTTTGMIFEHYQLKELSTILIPDNLFIVTLSEQNTATQINKSDIITILGFEQNFEKDSYELFEYDSINSKYKINILKVGYLKINIMLNIVKNIFKLNQKFRSPLFPTTDKITNLFNSDTIQESFKRFQHRGVYEKQDFENLLIKTKQHLVNKNIFSKILLDELEYSLDVMYREYKDHFIYLLPAIVNCLDSHTEILFSYFIIDKYIMSNYGSNIYEMIGELSVEKKQCIINKETGILIYLSDIFMWIGKLDIRFYAPGDKCRNINFFKEPLNIEEEEYIYFEDECEKIDYTHSKYVDIGRFYSDHKTNYKNEIVYYMDNLDIYRIIDENIVKIKYYTKNSIEDDKQIYDQYYPYIDKRNPDKYIEPYEYQSEDHDHYEDDMVDYGRLYCISNTKSFIYGFFKFNNYINMKDDTQNFTVPNRRGLNLKLNNSESKFSRVNNLLPTDIIKFKDMYTKMKQLDVSKENTLLVITGCGNYSRALNNHYEALPEYEKIKFQRYIDSLGKIEISSQKNFNNILKNINETNIEITDEKIKFTKISETDPHYEAKKQGHTKRLNEFEEKKRQFEIQLYKKDKIKLPDTLDTILGLIKEVDIKITDEILKFNKISETDPHYEAKKQGHTKRIAELKDNKSLLTKENHKNKYYNKNYFELYMKYKNKYFNIKNK